MKYIMGASLLFSCFLPGPAAPAQAGTATSFVQATFLGRNATQGTLMFRDMSGRQRAERASAEAAAGLGGIRPGDEVILAIAVAAGRPVVTKVRPVRRAQPAPAEPARGAVVHSVPLRRAWPNPYVKGRPDGRPGQSAP